MHRRRVTTSLNRPICLKNPGSVSGNLYWKCVPTLCIAGWTYDPKRGFITVVYRVSRNFFRFLRVTFLFFLNFSLYYSVSERSANLCIQNRSKTLENPSVFKSNLLFVGRQKKIAVNFDGKYRYVRIRQWKTKKKYFLKIKIHSQSNVSFLRIL